MFAAKYGRKCISVEPFYDSYIRFHKSILLENLKDKIILLTNGISNKRGEYKKLSRVSFNVGGQSLLGNSNDYSSKKDQLAIKNNKHIVETILLDDLVEILPSDFKNCIMKIDIEGYEVKAFQNASKLFERLNVLAGKSLFYMFIFY